MSATQERVRRSSFQVGSWELKQVDDLDKRTNRFVFTAARDVDTAHNNCGFPWIRRGELRLVTSVEVPVHNNTAAAAGTVGAPAIVPFPRLASVVMEGLLRTHSVVYWPGGETTSTGLIELKSLKGLDPNAKPEDEEFLYRLADMIWPYSCELLSENLAMVQAADMSVFEGSYAARAQRCKEEVIKAFDLARRFFRRSGGACLQEMALSSRGDTHPLVKREPSSADVEIFALLGEEPPMRIANWAGAETGKVVQPGMDMSALGQALGDAFKEMHAMQSGAPAESPDTKAMIAALTQNQTAMAAILDKISDRVGLFAGPVAPGSIVGPPVTEDEIAAEMPVEARPDPVFDADTAVEPEPEAVTDTPVSEQSKRKKT